MIITLWDDLGSVALPLDEFPIEVIMWHELLSFWFAGDVFESSFVS